MQDRSVFVSSCSRRQLARRRAARSMPRIQLLIVLALLAALAAVVVTRAGV
jgi:hypothetical protein